MAYDVHEQDVDQIMDTMDTDKSGAVDVEEFVVMVAKATSQEISEEEKQRAFTLFQLADSDGDGKLSFDEMFRAMKARSWRGGAERKAEAACTTPASLTWTRRPPRLHRWSASTGHE